MALLAMLVLFVVWKIIENSSSIGSSSQRLIRQGFKIVISSVQLMATFSRLQGNLPAALVGLFSVLDIGNLNVSVLGYECGGLLESYWSLWKIKIFAPFVVLFIFLMVLLVSAVLQKMRLRNAFDWGVFVSKRLSSAVYGYLQLISILYTLMVSALLEPFLCSAQVDGTYTMLRNPSVQCYTDIWQRNVLPYLIPLGLLYCVALPFGLFVLLFLNRHKTDSANFQNYFGFLTRSYRREVYWYELAVILKKVLFITVPEFLALNFSMSMKLFSSILILVFFHIHFQLHQPYSQENLNRLTQQ
jgi:hypothetical protein